MWRTTHLGWTVRGPRFLSGIYILYLFICLYATPHPQWFLVVRSCKKKQQVPRFGTTYMGHWHCTRPEWNLPSIRLHNRVKLRCISLIILYTEHLFPVLFHLADRQFVKSFEVTSTETGITAGEMCPWEKLSANKFKLCVADSFFSVVIALSLCLNECARVHETMVVCSRRHDQALAGFWGVWNSSFFYCCCFVFGKVGWTKLLFWWFKKKTKIVFISSD